MAFTVSDFGDLKRLLADHPEWRVELRQLLLSEDFEALPGIVRRLAEAHERAEQRLSGIEDRLARVEQRLERVEARLEGAEQRLDRLEETVGQLVEAHRRAEERLERLEHRMHRVEVKLARIDGRTLELAYREKAPAYFGRWIRRVQLADLNDLMEQLESRLGDAEAAYDVLLADLVLRGQAARLPHRPEVWLTVEISSVVDREDVRRAVRRAERLRQAGLPAIPVVAGEDATEGAETESRDRGVPMLQDGVGFFWDEAWNAWPV